MKFFDWGELRKYLFPKSEKGKKLSSKEIIKELKKWEKKYQWEIQYVRR